MDGGADLDLDELRGKLEDIAQDIMIEISLNEGLILYFSMGRLVALCCF